MKILNYTLVGVLGATLASLATYRLLDGGESVTAPVVEPVVRREFFPAPTPVVSTGPSVAELEELTRKNAELTTQLAEERARRETADLTLTKTREDLDELRRPMMSDVLSSSLRAELKSGEVVVTGGYKLPDGTRLYAFVQPTVERVDGVDVVNIASTFRMLSDETGQRVGLENLATNAANTLQHGEVWAAEEQAAVLGILESAPGLRGISYPGVKVPNGVSSVIEAGMLRLKVTPKVGADSGILDFEVRLEQPQQVQADATAIEPAATTK